MSIYKSPSKVSLRDPLSGSEATIENDATGLPALRTIVSSNGNSLIPYDFFTAVSLGIVPGHERASSFGYNLSTSSGFEPIWSKSSSSYTFPSTASTLTVSSSSNSDTLTGSGGRVLIITGLDATYSEITEQINLNGTSNVTTTNSFLRVNESFLAACGSNQSNVGNIDIQHSGNTIAYIRAGDSQQQQVVFTVPAGKSCLLYKGFFSYDKDNSGQVKLYIIAGGVKRNILDIVSNGEQTDYTTVVPFVIPQTVDIIAEASVSTGSPGSTGGLEFILVDL